MRSVRRWAGPGRFWWHCWACRGLRHSSWTAFRSVPASFWQERSHHRADLSSASESILAGIQLLKNGLGLAALSVLGAEFVPLYLGLMIQLALLMGCSLLCSLTGISRCRALFDCFAEAVRCMAAVVALFFGLAAAGVTLLFIVGGGS